MCRFLLNVATALPRRVKLQRPCSGISLIVEYDCMIEGNKARVMSHEEKDLFRRADLPAGN
jgi:hypothetical protein